FVSSLMPPPPSSTLVPYTTLFRSLLARPDDDVAAGAAARAEARGLLQKPDAHLETKILRGQRADGADVGRVEGVVVVEAVAGIRDRKSTRLNSSHGSTSYAVFCLK